MKPSFSQLRDFGMENRTRSTLLSEKERLSLVKQCEDHFVYLVARSYFRLWQPEDTINPQGSYWLLGVAIWSHYDIRLLEELANTLSANSAKDRIDVFDIDNEEYRRCFEIHYLDGKVIHGAPVLAHWEDGRLIKTEQAGLALRYVVTHFQLPQSIMQFPNQSTDCDRQEITCPTKPK